MSGINLWVVQQDGSRRLIGSHLRRDGLAVFLIPHNMGWSRLYTFCPYVRATVGCAPVPHPATQHFNIPDACASGKLAVTMRCQLHYYYAPLDSPASRGNGGVCGNCGVSNMRVFTLIFLMCLLVASVVALVKMLLALLLLLLFIHLLISLLTG